jgi:TrmH family RNA methyltransferase
MNDKDHPTSQLTGPEAIASALAAGESIGLLLVRKGPLSTEAKAVVAQAQAAGIPLRMESVNDLRRMGRGTQDSEVLALVGRHPEHDLAQLMAGDGAVWLISGGAYPANVGVTIRTVEVSGAAGLVIDGEFTRKMKHLAMRVAMRADRFMPVLWESSLVAIEQAKAAGRPIVALEDTGTLAPWDVDLSGNPLIVVGGERDGIVPEVLACCDSIVRIPMPGFIGSYNVQIAVSMVAAERLRQRS